MVDRITPSQELRHVATDTSSFAQKVTLAKFGPIQFSASPQLPNPEEAAKATKTAMDHMLKYDLY